MASSAQDIYLESRILSADGVELVRILYQAALESVEKARRHLKEGDIAARSREITRASAVLSELAVSLDLDVGGALSRNLLELYDYMQRRLLEANFLQSEPILAEVSRLLATLLEGWMSCNPDSGHTNEAPIVDMAPDYGGLVAVSC
ncbi:MAG: flagellar export chaperone FliS [Rhodospirillales bacterium]